MTDTRAVTTIGVGAQEQRTVVIDAPGTYVVELLGEGAEVTVKGAFASTGKENSIVDLVIHHKAAHTRAQTTLKGVADDASRLSFKGKIVIDPGCPDTQSFLTERILLLSNEASAEAIPELEILSDDVKCSHAASVSKIPEVQLFYLQSRGIARKAAEKLIVESFLVV